MATGLTACKSCEAKVAVSAKTCPHCGVSNPGRAVGALVVRRVWSDTGRNCPMVLVLDSRPIGEIGEAGCFEVEVEVGEHAAELRGGGLCSAIRFVVENDGITVIETRFSNLGLLGGGILVNGVSGNFPTYSAPAPPPNARPYPGLLVVQALLATWLLVAVGVLFLVFLLTR